MGCRVKAIQDILLLNSQIYLFSQFIKNCFIFVLKNPRKRTKTGSRKEGGEG